MIESKLKSFVKDVQFFIERNDYTILKNICNYIIPIKEGTLYVIGFDMFQNKRYNPLYNMVVYNNGKGKVLFKNWDMDINQLTIKQ